MTLTKAQRVDVFNKFGGKCAYCGNPLGTRWHADHVKSVKRKTKYVRDKNDLWKTVTVGFWAPENDHAGNIFPACAPCNIHKSDAKLEDWRRYIERQVEIARRNSAPFRHAERFGLITTSAAPIVFHFEKFEATHES